MLQTLLSLCLALSGKPPRKPAPRRPAFRRPAWRPHVEALEDRCVPSAAGNLDTTFGNGAGYITHQNSPYGGGAASTLIQPNGDIIVDGTLKINSSGTLNFYLERLNPDGSLDTSFGNGGLALASFSSGLPSGYSTPALYPQAGTANDGKIVIVGNFGYNPNGPAEQVVERFNANGTLDTSFGNGGEVMTSMQNTNTIDYSAVVVTPSGQIVTLGYDDVSNHFELVRYNSNGSLDTTFGQGGQVTTYVPNGAETFGFDTLLQQPDGELVVITPAGGIHGPPYVNTAQNTWDLYAFNANGTPNTSFGNQGVVTIAAPASAVAGPATAAIYYNAGPSQDGQIVVLGSSVVGDTYGNPPYTLVRFNANGSLDSTFGVGGIAALPALPNFYANLTQFAVDAQGRAVLTGTNYASNDSAELVRVNASGTLDSSFGNGGAVTELFADATCFGKGVAIEPTAGTPYGGDIVQVGGFGGSGTTFVARYLSQATTPYLTVTGPASVTAGTAGTYTISVLNPDGSADTGYSGTVQITSSDPQAVLPANFTITGGTATFSATLKTAGPQSLTATDTATPGINGSDASIQVNPGAATHFSISGPSSVKASTAFSLTVTALDAYGNVAAGYTGTIKFTDSVSGATLPGNYTFTAADNGVHTFTGLKLKTKRTQTLTVTDTLTGSIVGTLIITVS